MDAAVEQEKAVATIATYYIKVRVNISHFQHTGLISLRYSTEW